MDYDILKRLKEIEMQKALEEAQLGEATDRAAFEAENTSNAVFRQGAEDPSGETGFYLNKPEQLEETPTYRFLKLQKMLGKK